MLVICHFDHTGFIEYFHDSDYDTSQFAMFIGSILWFIFAPVFWIVIIFNPVVDSMDDMKFNPFHWSIKKMTAKAHVRNRVIEEI